MLALLLACVPHPTSAASPRAPAWVEKEGPWTAGSYVDLAVGGDVHAIWVEGDTLRYARVGGPTETVATGVETGDAGQLRPEIVLDPAGVPHVAYAAGSHVWLATRGGAWTSRRLDEAETGARGLLAMALVGGVPTVAWLDTRRDPATHRTGVWVAGGGAEREVYTGGEDGICVCCKPALVARGDELVLAFRDADGPKREIRQLTLGRDGWSDAGDATHGGWSPGGCPADGPAIGPDALYVSDARDGRRRIWRVDAGGETALPTLHPDRDAVQPRVTAEGVVTWVEVAPGASELVLFEAGQPMRVTATDGRMEPGDPVVVGNELWIPWQGDRARVIAQIP